MSWRFGITGHPGGRPALWAGLATLVLVAGAGTVYALTHQPRWEAESRLAVFPSEANPSAQASYYETLSTGQIVQTIADLLDANLTADVPANTTVAVHVIPNTSLVAITTTADTASGAEALADDSLGEALVHVANLRIPFEGLAVSEAENRADQTGVPVPILVGGAVIAALILAVGVANAVAGLVRTRSRATTAGK